MIRRLGLMAVFLFWIFYPGYSFSERQVIYIIVSGENKPYNDTAKAFRDNLEENWKSNIISVRVTDQGADNRKLIKDIDSKKPALIFTIGTEASRLIKENVKNIPVVFALVVDPVSSGIIRDVKVPENLISGVSLIIPPRKQLQAIKDICPSCKRIGVIYDPAKSGNFIKEAGMFAPDLNLTLIKKEIFNSNDVSGALNDLISKIDFLWLIPDETALTWDNREYLIKTAVINKIPFYGLSKPYVKKGALLSLFIDYEDMGKQAANLGLRFLMGENLIPIESPEKTHLMVNRQIADSFGLKNMKEKFYNIEFSD